MSDYLIGGHLLRDNADCLKAIEEFALFKPDKQADIPEALLYLTYDSTADKTVFAEPYYRYHIDNAVLEIGQNEDICFIHTVIAGRLSFRASIHPKGKGFHVRIAQITDMPSYLLRYVIWIIYEFAAIHRQSTIVHASAVLYNGKAVIFLGQSGTGKSTHAALWPAHIPGAELLNDDTPVLSISQEGTAKIYGSPWSGKTPCYKPIHAPLAAVVSLRQAPVNRIWKLRPMEAIEALLISLPLWIAYNETMTEIFNRITLETVGHIPVYALECLPDADAAKLVLSTLSQKEDL